MLDTLFMAVSLIEAGHISLTMALNIVIAGVLSIFVATILGAIYRVYFHPLAHIPGPLLAKVSSVYAYYYNFRDARFYLQIQKLHEQYGPVVRITPHEVHLSDPSNCDKIYTTGSKYPKDGSYYYAIGVERATFTTTGPAEHRVKKAALNQFFSRRKVLLLEDIVQQKADKVLTRMQSAFELMGEIDLHYPFRAVSVDVITDYAFNNSYGFLDQPGFGREFFDLVRGFGPATLFFQAFPEFRRWALNVPLWLGRLVNGHLESMIAHREGARQQIVRVKEAVDKGEKSLRTIFHQLLQPDAAEGYIVPSVDELADEAYTVLGAAADTTGNALTIGAYNVVINADIYQRLATELKEAFPTPDDMSFAALEKLPYLTAVIKEALRLSFGVPSRLPRVVPSPGATFNGYYVPEGAVVSMSSWTMHHDKTLFPSPDTFNPDRWTDPSISKTLERYLFAFGKGARQCVGMQLAYCELYVTLGRLFRQYDSLRTRKKQPEEMVYDDYFSSHHPVDHSQFIFKQSNQ